ncbi:MAG: hypothetical protein AABW59_04150 [archaeon]
MRKGQIFSIEALIVIAIVIGVIGMTIYLTQVDEGKNVQQQIILGAEKSMTLYFNKTPSAVVAPNIYCLNLPYYLSASKTFSTKNVCRGFA